MRRIGIRAVALALLALALSASSALAAPAVSGEFEVSSEIDTNNKIVEGPDGNMWLTLNDATENVARITPAGVVTEYALGVTGASGIARGPEGNLWITETGGVTKFSPSAPEGTKATTAIPAISTFHSIVAGPDGNLWVATVEKVIKVPPANPSAFQEFTVAELSPRDIDVAGPLLAVADAGVKPRVLTLTTSGTEKGYDISGASQGVAADSGGLIAYSQQGSVPEQVGLIAPPNASPPIDLPGGVGDPFGVALGVDQAFWVVLSGKDGVERLTKSGEISFLGGLATGSQPRQIAAGPGNTLWVTLQATKKVARISGLEPPPPPAETPAEPISAPGPPAPLAAAPETVITKGPKGKVRTKGRRAAVKFRFGSPDAGASFECRLVRRAAKKAKASKVPAFKACKSPKSYRLVPGRYRFEVRAVLGGTADATPAKRGFRVARIARHR
jgi:streptogramin lyase